MDWARILAYVTGKARRSPGRPRIKQEVEQLIVRMAKENRDWGYDRIAGALANLGMRSAIRLSAMSCNATLYRPHPSASARQPGRPSFAPI